jgi:hypothetical protein
MKYRHLPSRIRNALKTVWQVDVCRLQPLAMFNWRYLLQNQPDRQALHRQLWWRTRYKLPIVFWLPLELVRWMYWQIWSAPRKIRQVILKHGEVVEGSHGVSIVEQRRIISYWAKSWCISPSCAYDLGLFKPEANPLNVILSAEVQPFHRLMNGNRGALPADYRLLFDKSLLSEHLAAAGIPVVPDIAESDGSLEDLHNAIAASGPVFCKLRAGSRGESAFMAESGINGMIGQSLAGKALANEAEVIAAWNTLVEKGTVLIQPYLRNHSMLQRLSPDGESITLRVITRACDDGFKVWTGLLYVQAPGELAEREYWLLKIDDETGQAYDAFGHWQDSVNDTENELSDYSKLIILEGQSIPFWRDIVRHSIQAHAELPRLWTIAWDWIVTPDGPLLLEGNAGWDLSPLQEIGVDFVKIGCELTAKLSR